MITKLPPLPIFGSRSIFNCHCSHRFPIVFGEVFTAIGLSLFFGLGSASGSCSPVFSSGLSVPPSIPLLQQLLLTCLTLLLPLLTIWPVSLSAAGVQCAVLSVAGLLPLPHSPQTLQCCLLLQMPRSTTICLHSWLLSLLHSLLSLHLSGLTDVLPLLLLLLPLYVLICDINVSVLIMPFSLRWLPLTLCLLLSLSNHNM